MQKNIRKKKRRDPVVAARVKNTADIVGVSNRTVYRVIKGDSINITVLRAYMNLLEGERLLLEEVKRIIPFN
ncbi:MAG: hypothetical protein IT249_19950 [Chitinophagaceae bacterium]|nr:hypothetical protein [Chitinophagaceae bacterium]